jgi:hypothetical protein
MPDVAKLSSLDPTFKHTPRFKLFGKDSDSVKIVTPFESLVVSYVKGESWTYCGEWVEISSVMGVVPTVYPCERLSIRPKIS